MLWNCLITKRIGGLHKIDKRMNFVDYLKLLQVKLYSLLVNFDFDLDEVIFQV